MISKKNLQVGGYLHDAKGNYFSGKRLEEYFANIDTIEVFHKLVSEANGCFFVIYYAQDTVYAAVDRIRSIPIFYKQAKDSIELSLKATQLTPLNTSALQNTHPSILAEYLATGYVSGNDTLHAEIHQIPAGHYLIHKIGRGAELVPYYQFIHCNVDESNSSKLCLELDKIHSNLANRLVESLNGQTAVIPLSGGYDSRLIAYLLKISRYPKVICFSYGSPNNPESEISQAVAKELELPWKFIPHSRQSWHKAFNSSDRKEFFKFSVNATSSAHIQDFLAVKTLRNKGIIPEDSIFIPGHSADFLEGSHLPDAYEHKHDFSRDDLYRQILNKHYTLWNWQEDSYYKDFCSRIERTLQIKSLMRPDHAASLFEQWDWQERQAKFIVNSVRVYEFFGYQWRLPLWDSELMNFWARVPLKLRLKRSLWLQYAAAYLPIEASVLSNPHQIGRASCRERV